MFEGEFSLISADELLAMGEEHRARFATIAQGLRNTAHQAPTELRAELLSVAGLAGRCEDAARVFLVTVFYVKDRPSESRKRLLRTRASRLLWLDGRLKERAAAILLRTKVAGVAFA